MQKFTILASFASVALASYTSLPAYGAEISCPAPSTVTETCFETSTETVAAQTVYATKVQTVTAAASTITIVQSAAPTVIHKVRVQTIKVPEMTTCPAPYTTTAYETEYASALPVTCPSPKSPATTPAGPSGPIQTTYIVETHTLPGSSAQVGPSAPVYSSLPVVPSSAPAPYPIPSGSSNSATPGSEGTGSPMLPAYTSSPAAFSSAPAPPAPIYSSSPVAPSVPAPYPVPNVSTVASPVGTAVPSSGPGYNPSPYNPNVGSGLNGNAIVAAFGAIAAAAFML